MSYLLNFPSLALYYDITFHKSLPHEYASKMLKAKDVDVEDSLNFWSQIKHNQNNGLCTQKRSEVRMNIKE